MLYNHFHQFSYMMNYFTSLTIIILAISLSVNQVESAAVQRILGGKKVNEGQIGYQLSVQDEDGINFCAAGLIHAGHAVSAAHCFVFDKTNTFKTGYVKVVGGSVYLNNSFPSGIENQVVEIFIPRNYRELDAHTGKSIRTASDIAVLKLLKEFDLSDSRLSLLVIPTAEFMQNQEILKVAGFGDDAVWIEIDDTGKPEEKRSSDNFLRVNEVEIIDNEECQGMYVVPILDSNMCARVLQEYSDYPEGTCEGDLGTPLVFQERLLVGILIIRVKECDETFKPAIYVKAFPFLNFLQNVLNGFVSKDYMRTAVWTANIREFVEVEL